MKRTSPFRLVLSTIFTMIAFGAVAIGAACVFYNHWTLAIFYSFMIHISIVGAAASVLALVAARRNVVAMLLLVGALTVMIDARRAVEALTPELTQEQQEAGTAFRLLSFNVLGENVENGPRIADMLIEYDADVVYVLEAVPLKSEIDRLAEVYPYRVGCGEITEVCSSIMLSKYPVERPEVRDLSRISRSRYLTADIEIGGRRIRFVSAHTTKPYYDGQMCSEIWRIFHLQKNYEGLLVLGGDFTAALEPPCLRQFLRVMALRPARHAPATWPVEAIRYGIAIDHIFARAPLVVRSTIRLPDNMGSNHFGIVSEIVVDPAAAEPEPGEAVDHNS
jgi:endonuclease/exonuclease/phosphatase (EEP) superfamily protein YafD